MERLLHILKLQTHSLSTEARTEITCCVFVFVPFPMFPLQAFGGYLTLKMLAATHKLFQCTAAVAPITDFRLYSELQSHHQLFMQRGHGNCSESEKQSMSWFTSCSTVFRCSILREISRPPSQGGARLLGEALQL